MHVYVLIITSGVDDYKSRGCTADSDVSLHCTKKSAEKELKRFLIGDLSGNIDDKKFKKVLKLIKKGYDIDKIHEKYCLGEYIPYRWIYRIEYFEVPEEEEEEEEEEEDKEDEEDEEEEEEED